MLAFNQLVIDANDIRFNRGGSYGKGDVDTVQGWVGEMGILKDTFSEVSGSRPNLFSPTPWSLAARTVAYRAVLTMYD